MTKEKQIKEYERLIDRLYNNTIKEDQDKQYTTLTMDISRTERIINDIIFDFNTMKRGISRLMNTVVILFGIIILLMIVIICIL